MAEFVAGLAGGAAGVVVGHPFDTVKVKLQTQDFKNPKYKGTFDCFAKTVKSDGTRGLFRGMASPICGVGAVNAIAFGVHGNVVKLFKDQDAMRTHLCGGVASGVVQSFVCSPVELVKTRLQIQADAVKSGTISTAKYHGPMDCVKKIYKSSGFKGVFKGQISTTCREVPAFATYFASYEWLSKKLTGANQDAPSSAAILFSGGCAGMLSWIVSYPIDVVKSRIQSDGAFYRARYTGYIDCMVKSVKEEGFSVFGRGLGPTILRAFPTNAATFFVASKVAKELSQFEKDINDNTAVLKEIIGSGAQILDVSPNYMEKHTQHFKKIRLLTQDHQTRFLPSIRLHIPERLDLNNEDMLFEYCCLKLLKFCFGDYFYTQ